MLCIVSSYFYPLLFCLSILVHLYTPHTQISTDTRRTNGLDDAAGEIATRAPPHTIKSTNPYTHNKQHNRTQQNITRNTAHTLRHSSSPLRACFGQGAFVLKMCSSTFAEHIRPTSLAVRHTTSLSPKGNIFAMRGVASCPMHLQTLRLDVGPECGLRRCEASAWNRVRQATSGS